MARCEIARDCLFFNDRMAIDPEMAALFKLRFCQGSNRDCARYIVFTACGRPAVPTDLAPNDKLRARTIVFETTSRRDSDSLEPPEVSTR